MSSRRCCALALVAVCFAAGSCSVAANLSANALLSETYGIVKIEGKGNDTKIRYIKRAQVSLWWARVPLFWPIDPVMRLIFGRTGEYELENPGAHVRELLIELPDETGSDFELNVSAATWFGWVAQLDPNPHNRLVAIDGLARVAQALELPLFQGNFAQFGQRADPAEVGAARSVVEKQRPEARASAAPPDAAALRAYVDALTRLTAAPLENAIARVEWFQEVVHCYASEPIDEVREATVAPVRAALRHMIEGLLVSIVRERDNTGANQDSQAQANVELRLCAMAHIRQLGGPRAVPLLLAVMACTPAERARNVSQFDPDELVMLRLIQYCGQLRGELATTTVQLPGRQGFELVSPQEFLAVTILNQDTYYSKLRVPALAALTWSLQRPRLDPDVKWVRAWREEHR